MRCRNCKELIIKEDGSYFCKYTGAYLESSAIEWDIPCPIEEDEEHGN